ncbi:MAG TPA: helix-turn-helix transcriptional regulator [Beutenbergiaceae bacterium]|nr:helix-turn-helix transcriptional regulator [Beutenbergiaceae bacterium]
MSPTPGPPAMEAQDWSILDDEAPRLGKPRDPVDELTRVQGLASVVSANIRLEMARHDFTQDELAAYLYRSRAAISRRINGAVAWSLEDLGKIAEALGLRPHELLCRPGELRRW